MNQLMLNRAIELIKPCPGLFDHAQDVARLVFHVAGTLGLDSATLKTAALVHDVGKCTWPMELHKKNPLSPEDFKIIYTHPIIGEKILCDLWPDIPKRIRELVRWHHERPGGKGYPDCLLNPTSEVLVLASCDVYSAMTSNRPYRVGTFPIGEALMEVAKFAPPQVVAALADAVFKQCVNQ